MSGEKKKNTCNYENIFTYCIFIISFILYYTSVISLTKIIPESE